MYRDAGTRPEVLITLRPLWRARAVRLVLVGAVAAIALVLLAVRPFGYSIVAALVVFAVTTAVLVTMRRRRVDLVRNGPELRVEDGSSTSSALLNEVRGVELDSASASLHGLVLVLSDGRRIPLGAPSLRMVDALAVRRRVRRALDLAVSSRA